MEVVEESRVCDNSATFDERRCFLIFFYRRQSCNVR